MTALSILAGLALEDGRRWGDAAEPWQWADARAVLDDRRRQSYLTRPRGASKTTDVAGVAIAALIDQLAPRSRSYAAAADRDQAALIVDAIGGFVARTPEIGGALTVDTWRVTSTATGATLDVLAADAAGTWGLRPHLLLADEFAQWPTTPQTRRFWEALFSALVKVEDSRLVVMTTAGDPVHPAGKLIARAHADPDGWYVNEVDGPCPWVSQADLDQQRAELTESQYARLHLNKWMAAADRLVKPEDLAACVVLDGPQAYQSGQRYVIGVDLGLRHDRTAIAVCHAVRSAEPPESRVVLDRLHVLAGTRQREVSLADVEEAIVVAWTEYGRPRVRLDPWQAIGLAQRLRSRRVTVEEVTFSAAMVGRLASTLHLLLRDRLLDLPDDEALIDELANVRLRETSPGVVRLDHDASRHDDRAVALALAATALVERGDARTTVSTASAQAHLPTPASAVPGRRVGPLARVAGRRP